ncbi:MAG: hypothetical protein JSR53_02410 [Proteobacteria bacterium]|nr:hypothetical protein [Pseudomonadota bacterium]
MTITIENSQEIDERIEKRLALLRDSMELKLTKEVDQLLKIRFETTGKFLSLAFGLVALVFTAFGVKTLLDVKEVARDTAIMEVKKKLAIDDPNSDFRRDIDKVVARGLIDSYLLALAKNKEERFQQELSMSENDLRRIRAVITDKRTSVKDFSDAVEVLLKSSARAQDDSTEVLVKDLAAATEDQYRWFSGQPEKLAALLRFYTGDALISRSAAVLSDEKAPKSLKLAAIAYSGKQDIQSGTLLGKLTTNSDSDIANGAASALARVDPSSLYLKAVLDAASISSDDNNRARAIRIAIELAKPSLQSNPFVDDPKLDERRKLAAEVIRSAIRSDFVFRLSRDLGGGPNASLYVSSRKNPHRYHRVSNDVLLGPARGAISALFLAASKDPKELFAVVRALCLDEDERCWGLIRLDLTEGARVTLEGGQEIDSIKAPGGVSLRSENAKADSPIVVTWTDTDANSKRGKLISLVSPENIRYSVAVSKTLARTDED